MSITERDYLALLDQGTIEVDPAQAEAVAMLGCLERALDGWRPGKRRFPFGAPTLAPRGIYLYGGVGVGKSMLMDLFCQAASVERKRRAHFHAFMLQVHRDIGAWRKMDDAERRRQPHYVRGAGDDPIAPVAQKIADASWLLCFDEFQVTDIADAMILGRLFDQLFQRQVVVVATSNRHPRDLYLNGLNRQLFLPFIAMLEEKLTIKKLVGRRDYRLMRLEKEPVYHAPLGPGADAAMVRAWRRMTDGATPAARSLQVDGRVLPVPRAAGPVAWFSFEELCDRPYGSADYLAIAQSFDTILLENVPMLSSDRRSAAARFRNLIDALYETRTKLILSAAAEPHKLYPAGEQSFEFERTASRLHEMRGHDYLAEPKTAQEEPRAGGVVWG